MIDKVAWGGGNRSRGGRPNLLKYQVCEHGGDTRHPLNPPLSITPLNNGIQRESSDKSLYELHVIIFII